MSLEGRIALVTGGGRGIGRAIALALAEDGADVAVNYRRDREAAIETVTSIEKLGRRAHAYQAAVASHDEDEAMVAEIAADLGPIDILVNNAGMASRGQTVEQSDPSEPERVVSLHGFAPFYLSRLVLPGMRSRARGDIVMISSAYTRLLPPNSAPYSMGKAAMEALAATLAKEVAADGIRVNIVAPGLVVTDMGSRLVKATKGIDDIRDLDEESPFGRVCRAEDVANVVRYLVSERSGYLTGQRLYVDGAGSFG
jgi:NAD(P)-dependent dehydrogenase (short-subunit alcohol dehydrogenase family)